MYQIQTLSVFIFFQKKSNLTNVISLTLKILWSLNILLSTFSVSMEDLQWGHISTVIGSPLKFCTNMHLMYQKTQTSSSDTCSRSELRTFTMTCYRCHRRKCLGSTPWCFLEKLHIWSKFAVIIKKVEIIFSCRRFLQKMKNERTNSTLLKALLRTNVL